MNFQRARTDEQRDQRRRAILGTAATMLTEMSVVDLSLNELSRRVGLAKVNVLRYFESREAVLLELLSTGFHAWAEALDIPSRSDLPLIERAAAIGSEIAGTLACLPVLCDLMSAQAAVLERNVSMPVALQHKRTINVTVDLLIERLAEHLPELNRDDMYQLIASTILMASAAWPQSQPTEALLAAYAEDAAVAAHRLNFEMYVQETVLLTILGLNARGAVTTRGSEDQLG
jgi:AcrR family transcriptional regulator